MEQFDALLAQTIDSTLVRCYNGYYCDKTLKHPNLRIFNIIRIFALRKYQIVSNFYLKNKEKNI